MLHKLSRYLLLDVVCNMLRNDSSFKVFHLGLLAFCLLTATCSRKLQQTTTQAQSSTTSTAERAPGTPKIDDQIPMVDDGTVNGPARSAAYAPTEYIDFPSPKAQHQGKRLSSSNGCNFVGEVWDFMGEGSCQQVIETTDGYLFSITGVPPGYFLEGGSRIRFGFNYDQITPDDCSPVDGSIRITCLQLLRAASGFPRPIVCRSYDEPSQWIHELTVDLSATYVTRFPWKDERLVYLFETPSGQYLYDCRGFILCQPPTNCLQFIEDFNKGVQIFEG